MALTEYSAGGVSCGDPAGSDTDRAVVLLRGDASTVTALSEDMARAIALDDADLVVDLSGVESMDAATARTTSGVSTLALADDSTLVQSGYRATA